MKRVLSALTLFSLTALLVHGEAPAAAATRFFPSMRVCVSPFLSNSL